MDREALFYRRVLGTADHACVVCGERVILDEHHIEFSNGRSNKESKTVWLCPTHHMAIHRGFSRFDEGVFVWVVDDIRDGLRRKHPDLTAALQQGRSWAAK